MKIALLLLSLKASALTVGMEWEASTRATGYRIYERLSADGGRLVTDVASGVVADGAFGIGVHTVYCVAYNEAGESLPSDPITFTVLAKKLEASNGLDKWTTVVEFEELDSPRRFWRVTTKP